MTDLYGRDLSVSHVLFCWWWGCLGSESIAVGVSVGVCCCGVSLFTNPGISALVFWVPLAYFVWLVHDFVLLI